MLHKKNKIKKKKENIRLILHTHAWDNPKESAYEDLFDLMAEKCFERSIKKADYIR